MNPSFVFWRCLIARVVAVMCFLFALVASERGAHAQLARTFSNITGIKVTRLPNAVVVRIQTDGTVKFGGDLADWVDINNGYTLKPTQSVRLRIVQARSKLPAYVPIDAYPLDGAAITLGRTPFVDAFFTDGAYGQPQPLIDVELRFATPVIIRQFTVQPGNSTWFGEYLGPREASIELSNDRRAIVITMIPDRADLTAPQRMDRSPQSGRKHKLSVVPLGEGDFRIEALNTPLRELLGGLGAATNIRFLARGEVADVPVSMYLPRTNSTEFLHALQRAANLGARDENGTFVLGRGDEFFTERSLPLFNMSPDAARLMFPDFLLPYLRSDRQNNAILAFQTPLVLDKIQEQLREIDTPSSLFEISAQFWELNATKDGEVAYQLLRSIGGDSQSIDVSTGESIVRLESGQTEQLRASLRLLSVQGRAKLTGNPRVSVLSGAKGTLFLGQTRYVQVVQSRGNGQFATAIPLKIGGQIEVTPHGSNAEKDPIRIDIAPRLSTVDAIETGTGLPTLGIRELSGSMVVGQGETVAFAGLESDLDFSTKRRTLKVLPSGRANREVRSLLVLVSARRLTWSEPKTAVVGTSKRRWVAINPSYATPE